MARKKVISLNADTTVGFGDKPGQIKAGKTLEGYFLGTKSVNTKTGPSVVHVIQTPKGNLGLWGSANLNTNLASVAVGNMVYITYKEMIKIAKGTMKVFDVEYDDENTIHTEGVDVNFSTASSEEDAAEEYETAEESFEEEIVEEVEEAPAPRAAAPVSRSAAPRASAPSAEARARAQALLGAKKR